MRLCRTYFPQATFKYHVTHLYVCFCPGLSRFMGCPVFALIHRGKKKGKRMSEKKVHGVTNEHSQEHMLQEQRGKNEALTLTNQK